jgi:hypothetical protein
MALSEPGFPGPERPAGSGRAFSCAGWPENDQDTTMSLDNHLGAARLLH